MNAILTRMILGFVLSGVCFAVPALAEITDELLRQHIENLEKELGIEADIESHGALLRQHIEKLEKELSEAREALAKISSPKKEVAEPAEAKKSRLRIGGAIRANYVSGDYKQSDRRGRNIGGLLLDTFRVNVDLDAGDSADGLIGKLEYRWYWYAFSDASAASGYSMMHTAWLGRDFGDLGTLKAGLVRSPFGPGPYGISTSWFFDQHYYVGLSDNRALGFRWTNVFDKLTVDFAYYFQDEGSWEGGTSRDSVRFSYDPVKWNVGVNPDGTLNWGANCDCGYQKTHQVNLRGIYAVDNVGEFGASLQYGTLKGTNVADDDGRHYAVSAHAKNPIGDFTLVSQLSYYKYEISDDTPWGTGDLIPMGAYDFAWPVATEGWIPAVNLHYNGVDPSAFWPRVLDSIKPDSITPYVEWSSIRKTRKDFNDSSMVTVGAAWAKGGWYIYTDFVTSDGNYFVGNKGDVYGSFYGKDGVGDFGANGNNRWKNRFNINLGYYF